MSIRCRCDGCDYLTGLVADQPCPAGHGVFLQTIAPIALQGKGLDSQNLIRSRRDRLDQGKFAHRPDQHFGVGQFGPPGYFPEQGDVRTERPSVDLQAELLAQSRQPADQSLSGRRRMTAQPGHACPREPAKTIQRELECRCCDLVHRRQQAGHTSCRLVSQKKQGQMQIVIGHAARREPFNQAPSLYDFGPKICIRPAGEKQPP